mmetsp:Transcript_1521/g.2869  ORF Transcript_1521/g.2869 Transcript_1521/m.2869 type:complete len:114 (+) Transcript_1521:1199-1540(+)
MPGDADNHMPGAEQASASKGIGHVTKLQTPAFGATPYQFKESVICWKHRESQRPPRLAFIRRRNHHAECMPGRTEKYDEHDKIRDDACDPCAGGHKVQQIAKHHGSQHEHCED